MRQTRWAVALWASIGASSGCGGHAPGTPAAEGGAAPVESADDAMRLALANALQGRGRDAVAALQSLDPTRLAERYRPTRRCMLERLAERRSPPVDLGDRVLDGVLGAYHEYWLRSLLDEHPPAENEAWLLDRVNRLITPADAKAAADLDELEPELERWTVARGYHPLLGVTSPLRELMLWKNETERKYEVALPEATESVTVVFMDDFASLGWAGFATCDRHHSGGWTKPDRLYAVSSAYDTTSEDFRVSYLAHEGQHFSDNRRFPALQQPELEYRAKLVELALGNTTVYDLLDSFAANVGSDVTVPHSYANGRVVRDLAGRLFPGVRGSPPWWEAPVGRINTAAAGLLREDTERLTKGGPG